MAMVNVAKWGVASLPRSCFIDPKTEQVTESLSGRVMPLGL